MSKDLIQIFNNALNGDRKALIEITGLYPKEIDQLYTHWETFAEEKNINNSNYWYLSGLLHHISSKPSYDKAIFYYKKAMDLNNDYAMTSCAYMHEMGQGGPPDYDAAIGLYNQAIGLSNVVAMYNRAHIYMKDSNYDLAIALFQQCISQDYGWAMISRARMHENNQGGPIDYDAAAGLYDRASALGIVSAMHNRLRMHGQGHGPSLNYSRITQLIIQIENQVPHLQNENLKRVYIEDMSTIKGRLPSYYQFKIELLKNEESPQSYLINKFSNIFASSLWSKLKKYLGTGLTDAITFLTEMANDPEQPLKLAVQTNYCKQLLIQYLELPNKVTDPKTLDLIGETFLKHAGEYEDYKKRREFYHRVPKEAACRVEACCLAAQTLYFEAKKEGKQPLEAFEAAIPYLNEAVAAKDEAATMFYYCIINEVTKGNAEFNLAPTEKQLGNAA